MNGYDVDGISVWSVVVAEPPLFRQHFSQFVGVIALGFIGYANAWQAFFPFSQRAPRGQWRSARGSDANGDRGVYYFYAAE